MKNNLVKKIEISECFKAEVCRYDGIILCHFCAKYDPNQYIQCKKESALLERLTNL